MARTCSRRCSAARGLDGRGSVRRIRESDPDGATTEQSVPDPPATVTVTAPSPSPSTPDPPSAPPEPAEPSLEEIIRKTKSGIIRIGATTCDGDVEGTGILIEPRLIATAQHVVAGAQKVTLRQRGKVVGTGTVIGSDVDRDVALIRSDRAIEGYEFAFSGRTPRLGEDIVALGFPFGLPLTVTEGVVSGLNRKVEIEGEMRTRLIQTDAALNPGNSGGPLISPKNGDVVGLVTAGRLDANNIAFAVPSRTVAPLIEAWRAAPQAIRSSSCASETLPADDSVAAAATSDAPSSYSGNFTSVDRLERCYADDEGAWCTAAPSGKGVSFSVGSDPFYLGQTGSEDLGGPAMPMGTSFTTPGGLVTCESSSRGITCTDNYTGAYFVIGDYKVRVNVGYGEETY